MANQITILRALLVPLFVTAMVYMRAGNSGSRWLALGIFTFACLTDAVDGYIARLRKEQTLVGQVMDPVADKLLLISAFLCIYFSPSVPIKPPPWVIILIVSRDIFILAGIFVIYMSTGKLRANPSLLGKATTLSQMLTVIGLLIPVRDVSLLWNVTAVLTLASGFSYLWREVSRIREHALL